MEMTDTIERPPEAATPSVHEHDRAPVHDRLPGLKLRDDQARRVLENYKTRGFSRPSIRMLAKDWGWSPATTGRFVQAFDAETVAAGCETSPPVSALSHTEKSDEAEPTPADRRRLFVNAMTDFMMKFEGETDEAKARARAEDWIEQGISSGRVDLTLKQCSGNARAMLAASAGKEIVWTIPRQTEIVCVAQEDGSVEIEQECPLGGEPTRIHVADGNVVRLARNILFAAGFMQVNIATSENGGGTWVDIEDGQLARNFDYGEDR